MPSLYKTILWNAWTIAWRAKWLWFFGFFAAFMGSGGHIDILFNADALAGIEPSIASLKSYAADGSLLTFLTGLDEGLRANIGSTLLVGLLITVVTIIVVWIVSVSQVALIYGANKLRRQEKVDYTLAFAAGRHHALRVIGLNAIAKIVAYGLLVAMAAPLVAQITVHGAALFWELAFIISYLVLFTVISIITFYATTTIVLEGKDVPHAISRGWELFRTRWLVNVEFAFILVAVNILGALTFLLALFLAAIPIFLLALVFTFVASEAGLFLVISVGLLLLVVLTASYSALLATYQHAAWVLLYRELSAGRGIAKLVRLFAAGPPK
ncbi:MAG: hypothetical protein HY341_00465 [Candidatus Kerfeldbacteria bacterium]|nr:hypothetical protein [Candidatus Kerfeldbacteria bacterium]